MPVKGVEFLVGGIGSSSEDSESPDMAEKSSQSAASKSAGVSNLHTFLHFIKGSIGTGILAMPYAVKNAGLVLGTGGLVLSWILSTYCCHLLLRAYRRVSNDYPMTYAEVAESSFRRGANSYPGLTRFALPMRHFVNALIVLCQLGACCVYMSFCGRILKEVTADLEDMTNEEATSYARFFVTIVFILLTPYCFVTTLKGLATSAMIANGLTGVALLIIFQYILRHLQPLESVHWYPADPLHLALFFGTTMYSMGSITLILPLENSMKNRQDFGRILSGGRVMLTIMYVLMGFLGFLAFGGGSKMALSNLPHTGIYAIVKIMYALAIYVSYNLQLYVPVQILKPLFCQNYGKKGEYLLRFGLMFLTYLCAVKVPCLELMISLIGAFTSSCLALVLPPLLDLVSSMEPNHRSQKSSSVCCSIKMFRCFTIVSFGLFGCFVGTGVALRSIIDALSLHMCHS